MRKWKRVFLGAIAGAVLGAGSTVILVFGGNWLAQEFGHAPPFLYTGDTSGFPYPRWFPALFILGSVFPIVFGLEGALLMLARFYFGQDTSHEFKGRLCYITMIVILLTGIIVVGIAMT